jgi:hypothetical protein
VRAWAFMLGGLIVWTVHFFSIYIIASILLTSNLARILTLLVTFGCLTIDGVLLARALRHLRSANMDEFGRWNVSLAALAAAISMVAVAWQGLPAVLV